jgi:fluoroquinolone resistance protein
MEKQFLPEDKFYGEREFFKVNYIEQEIHETEFYKCQFTECNLYKTRFIDCEFENCTFEKCDMSLISLTGSRLLDVEFKETKILGVDWTVLKKPYRFSFNKCNLDNSSFYKMELNNLIITECSAREVDFIEANLSKVLLTYTDLYHARFNGANNAINYSINPNHCKMKKTIFSLPEAISLLNSFDLILK